MESLQQKLEASVLEADDAATLKNELSEFKFELLELYSNLPMSKVSILGKITK